MTDLNAIVESVETKCNCFGIRYHHEQVSVGDELPNSYDWDDTSPNYGNELDGTSALFVSWDGWDLNGTDAAIEAIHNYRKDGGCIVLIGGQWAADGQDHGEALIRDAVVLAVL